MDLDLTTDASPTRSSGSCRVGRTTSGPWGSGSGRSDAGRTDARFDITTHRAEAYLPDSRKPEVVFGDSIERDLSRRDFTINAVAIKLPDVVLIDPFDGIGRPRGQASEDPSRPCGVVRRRPAADAPRGAVHRPVRLVPDARSWRRSVPCTTG